MVVRDVVLAKVAAIEPLGDFCDLCRAVLERFDRSD